MLQKLKDGELTRGQLQRNAINILQFVLQSPAMLYEMDRITEEELIDRKRASADDVDIEHMQKYEADADGTIRIPGENWDTRQGREVLMDVRTNGGRYTIEVMARSALDELAQLPVTVYLDNIIQGTLSFRGSKGQWVTDTLAIGTTEAHHYMKLYFGATGLTIDHVRLRFDGTNTQ